MQVVFFDESDQSGVGDELLTFNLSKMVAFFVIISVVTLFWYLINYTFKNQRVRGAIEFSVMFGMCLLCYIGTGAAASNYKFLFALIILIYTMEFGLRLGMVFSGLSGAAILIGDVLSCPTAQRSNYFQADFILLATFCFLAYIVGFYVDKDRKLIATLEDSANRDSLTGLFNHRFFHQYIHNAIARNASAENFLFIMDIDYFKVYNDTLGHQKGDVVLKEISKICLEMIQHGEVFRYGGEEFAILVSAKDEKDAIRIANSLRLAIADYRFEGEELMPGRDLTVSIGVSEKRGNTDTVADWIERADNALYKAKFFRKNRVQMYSSVFERFDHLDQISDDERIVSIKTLLSVINSRDRYTYNHTDRVVHYCEIFSKYAQLAEKDSKLLLYGAYLHDIGKINIPQEILISEKKLTDEQWAEMKKHPFDGAEIVRKIKNFDTVAEIVQQHHEKFNGTGYPSGISGESIHPLARILTLADSFDAMTAHRPYQKIKTFEEGYEELRRCKGTQFDPQLTEIFISALKEVYG
jgi:diguanylate cyclase (GGDEF)-like protein/putative nucleotidyltransferase with HDIG domain